MKYWFVRNFYPGGFNFEFAFTASRQLKKSVADFDLIISIGLPVNSHLAVSRAINKKQHRAVLMADYGDPYSFSKIIRPPKWHRFMEKRMLKKFDFILIPTEKAIPSFLYFKKEEQIKIIPQGVRQKDIKLKKYESKGTIPHFIFAGNFYTGVREPSEILDFLKTSERQFQFTIYTNVNDQVNMSFLHPYLNHDEKRFIVRDLLERDTCIFELSGADFLVNISNTVDEHSPSKMIDYCLSKRPVYSYVPGKFDASRLEDFMDGNYFHDAAKNVNISSFDIERIVNEIVKLTQEVNEKK
ncbi:MAG: hypothetical protein IPM77_18570 [Crocinitomicaceae bacterium]|nr:hypothetical protein [Crocinitomicaceae bacterium]